MNLQSEITMVRKRAYDLARSDPSDSTLTDEEITDYIYLSELEVATDLHYQALYTLQKEASITTTNGTINYGIAAAGITDYMRLIGARYNQNGASNLRNVKFVDPSDFYEVQQNQAFRGRDYDEPYATIVTGEINVYPATVTGAVGGLKFRYLKRPTRRYKFFAFSSSVTGTASIEAGATGSKANGQATNAWVGSKMKAVSGALVGEEHAVTTSSAISGVFGFTDTWSVAPTVGDRFEVGEVSDLPEQWLYLALGMAVYRCLCKMRVQEEADKQMAEYQAGVARVNAAFQDPPKQKAALEALVQ